MSDPTPQPDPTRMTIVPWRADVTPHEPGPCPVCSGPRHHAWDSLPSHPLVSTPRIIVHCPTCKRNSAAQPLEMAVTAGASS